MSSCSRPLRLPFAAAAIALLFSWGMPCPAPAQPREAQSTAQQPQQDAPAEEPKEVKKLPKLSEMALPTAQELLQQQAVDWLILVNEDVIVTEPVAPRPNTIEAMKAKIQESTKWPRPKTDDEAAEQKAKREELRFFNLHLPEFEDEPEYRLDMKYVKEIVYHEDQMLRRVDQLLDDKDLTTAFEILIVLDRSQPDWPGFDERQNRLLFLEAEAMLAVDNDERALAYLEELHARKPEYSRLSATMGSVVDRLIGNAIKADDYRRARYFLARLSKRIANHPVVASWTTRLLGQASDLLEQADQAASQGRHDDAAVMSNQAAKIWPAAPNLREAHRRHNNRFQQLKVGVLRHAGDPAAFTFPTDADRRHNFLTQFSLFDVDQVDQEAAHYSSRYFDEWEPTDLGRQTYFGIKDSRPFWESREIVTASPIIAALAERLDPASPHYDERLVGYVDSIDLTSPFEFRLNFARVPLRLEGLLNFPLSAADSGARTTGNQAAPSSPDLPTDRSQNLFQRFRVHNHNDDGVSYRRAVPEPDRLSEYHVAEVTEIKYPSHDAAVQGLLRGEVSLLPEVQSWDVDPLSKDDRFFVQKYSVPVTHVLQFSPQSESLRIDELRRALVYGLDRRQILDEVILHGAAPDLARIATGPFATNSYAHNTLVSPREYDLVLAISLVTAAKKRLKKEIPTLKLMHDPDPIVTEAAKAIVADWKQIGVNVELVTTDDMKRDSGSPQWDIVYRKLRIVEPLLELWPILACEDGARVAALSSMPQWLRQQIVALDSAGDWSTAAAGLRRLHHDLWSEVFLIPLWEVDDFLVIRKTVRGFNPTPMHAYQGIENWISQPWYPTESL